MIEHIQGHARFAPSGATVSVDFQPKAGITAVVGENGAGKTFTAIESIRYLLFGSKALRGKLDTYAELSMGGLLAIHGQHYRILRTLKKAELAKTGLGDTFLAVGQEEVTKKVEELLGYGLEVFDLVNAAVQGETQSLGKLRPAQRKEKIDEVLRVTNVRAVEKAVREEANALKREAAALSLALPTPESEPKQPEGYAPSDQLEQQLSDARDLRNRREHLASKIKHFAPAEKPAFDRPTDQDVSDAERWDELQRRYNAMPSPEPLHENYIEAAEQRWLWEQARDAKGEKPTMELADVEAQIAVWDEIVAIDKMPDLEVTCPKCDNEFRTRPELPAEPALTRRQLLEQKQRHAVWVDPLPPEPTAEHGSLSFQQGEAMRDARALWEEGHKAGEELAENDWPGASPRELRKRIAHWEAYDAAVERQKAQTQDNAMIELALNDMALMPDIDALADRLLAAKQFEDQNDRFVRDKAKFDDLSGQIAEKQTKADAFLEGNRELSEARAELKSFLAPALSREASELIHDMTNGKLKTLQVDEDMAIVVDGQTIETLSGAGKTVADIALRIALAKVLTKSAFPVFIGDEMDGDLDAVRREATAQAMVSLKGHLKQIILITHKDVDIADHVITLGDTQ